MRSASPSPAGAPGFLPAAAVDRNIAGIPPEVARQAVTWLVELQTAGPTSDTDQAIQRWRAQDPAHERAWQRIESVNARLGGLASPLGSTLAQAALTQPATHSRRQAIKLLALALFAGGSVLTVRDNAPWQAWLADEQSATGERRTLRLADGSKLQLNSDSAVNIVFSEKMRQLKLVRGEILIDTGRDDAFPQPRPFRVETRDGALVPIGTRFSVRLHEDRTRLDVFAGAVEILPSGAVDRKMTIAAGNSVEFADDTISATESADENRIAWQDHMIVASQMRLADFVAEVDRHRPGRLHCDPAVAELRLSGSYPLGEPEKILDALRSTLPVEIHYITRYWATVKASSRNR
ncbi:FecR domain-containing protein [Azonexus sp.]|uniref:FecR domain-containing protein n=1 Tax=Azonexus sp. TaxID=1872668 RepID=UPI0027B97B4A|nr:FecR domain-containing protein [Azonexus sp.]